MAANFWKASKEVVQAVNQRIDRIFPELVELKADRISVLFYEKAKEKHGVVEYGFIKKAPPLLVLLSDKTINYEFIIYLAADRWENTLNNEQRDALIDHFLCSIIQVEDEKNQQVKFELRPPDIQMFSREVEHHGIWWPDSEALDHLFAKWVGPGATSTPTIRPTKAATPPSASAKKGGPGIQPPTFAAAGPKLPPKKAGSVPKGRPATDAEGDDGLDLPFVDGPSPLTN